MIADRIDAYLRAEGRTLDEDLLDWATVRLRAALRRQLMEAREPKGGLRLSLPLFCDRRVAYAYHGHQGTPVEPRVLVKFLGGDIYEVAVLTLAHLAGCDLGQDQAEVVLKANGHEVKGHIDDMLIHDGHRYVVEVKSVTQQGLKDFESDVHRWAQRWDYWGQAHRYAIAAQAQGVVFLAVCRDTGHIEEAVFTVDTTQGKRAQEVYERVLATSKPDDLNRAFDVEPEYTSVQGKAKVPEGIVAERRGSWYRWKTGRMVLGVECGYCPHNLSCWPGVEMEIQGGKPVWLIPDKKG